PISRPHVWCPGPYPETRETAPAIATTRNATPRTSERPAATRWCLSGDSTRTEVPTNRAARAMNSSVKDSGGPKKCHTTVQYRGGRITSDLQPLRRQIGASGVLYHARCVEGRGSRVERKLLATATKPTPHEA